MRTFAATVSKHTLHSNTLTHSQTTVHCLCFWSALLYCVVPPPPSVVVLCTCVVGDSHSFSRHRFDYRVSEDVSTLLSLDLTEVTPSLSSFSSFSKNIYPLLRPVFLSPSAPFSLACMTQAGYTLTNITLPASVSEEPSLAFLLRDEREW